MSISYSAAVFLVLAATLLWGSWFHLVKNIGEWPVQCYMAWLYLFGMILSWGVLFVLGDLVMPEGLFETVAKAKTICLLVLVCGVFAAVGLQINMIVINKLGLMFTTPISSFCSICTGTVVSSYFGKLPEGVSFWQIAVAVCVLLMASLTCDYARRIHINETKDESSTEKRKLEYKYFALMLIGLFVFSPALSFANSYAIRTDLNPDGIPAQLVIALVSVGAFIGSLAIAVPVLVKTRRLNTLFCPPNFKCVLYSAWSAVGHFGGNILIATASPFVSVALAWPMANSFYVWSYVWGIATHEFKNASKKAWICMIFGILLFVISIGLLANIIN